MRKIFKNVNKFVSKYFLTFKEVVFVFAIFAAEFRFSLRIIGNFVKIEGYTRSCKFYMFFNIMSLADQSGRR